jgi:hypothetical protein
MTANLVRKTSVVHALPGRLRVHLLNSSDSARKSLEQQLRHRAGVLQARFNPRTGNLLIHYDPRRTTQEHLLAALDRFTPVRAPRPEALETCCLRPEPLNNHLDWLQQGGWRSALPLLPQPEAPPGTQPARALPWSASSAVPPAFPSSTHPLLLPFAAAGVGLTLLGLSQLLGLDGCFPLLGGVSRLAEGVTLLQHLPVFDQALQQLLGSHAPLLLLLCEFLATALSGNLFSLLLGVSWTLVRFLLGC